MCPLRSAFSPNHPVHRPSNQDTVYLYGSGRREAPPSGQTAAAPAASATEGGQRGRRQAPLCQCGASSGAADARRRPPCDV